jgi:hypothetical protein
MSITDKLLKAIKSPDKTVGKIQQLVQQNITSPLLSPWRKGQVVMIHLGRSGSTVLANLLEQRDDFYWEGEIYEYHFWQYPYLGIPKDLYLPTYDFIKPRLRRAGNKYYGFEVKFFHLSLVHETLSDFLAALDSLDFQDFIVLKRENFLRKIVSSLNAHQQTGENRYHQSAKTKATLKQTEIDVNNVCIDRECKPLLAFLDDYEACFVELDQLLQNKRTLYLTYEADVAPDPHIGYQRICEFLNISVQPVQVQFSKTNPFPLNKLIVNFADVEQVLRNTRYEWMLYT